MSERSLLLDGMLDAVGELGFANVTIDAVAQRLGVPTADFYDAFEDTLSCYLEAVDAATERIEGRLVIAGRGRIGWRNQLRAGLAELLSTLEAEPHTGCALLIEIHAAGRDGVARWCAIVSRAAEFVDCAREEATGPPPSAVTAEGIVSGFHGLLYRRLASVSTNHNGTTGNGELRTPELADLLPQMMYLAVLPYFGAEAARNELLRGA